MGIIIANPGRGSAVEPRRKCGGELP